MTITPKQKITKYFLELTTAILVKFKTFQVIFFFISDIHWCLPILVFFLYIYPLTPGTFCQKMRFLDILMVLRLDLGQISINLVKNAFATRQPLKSRFTTFWLGNFFPLPFFSFSFLFAAVIGLLQGLLAVEKLLRKSHQVGQFLPWS